MVPAISRLDILRIELDQTFARLRAWAQRLRAWARTREGLSLLALLLVALLVRLLLATGSPYPYDPQLDVTWGQNFLAQPLSFYGYTARTLTYANYPPLSIYLFALVVALYSVVAHLVGAQPTFLVTQSPLLAVAIKLVPIACDVGLTIVIFALARKRLPLPWALAAAAAYAFSPYVLIIGSVWGQQDAIYTLASVLALLLAFQGKGASAGILSAAAVLLKPQPVVLLPLMVVCLWRWSGPRAAARYCIALAATGILITLPFLLPPHPGILDYVHNVSFVDVPVSSHGVLNFWWLVVMSMRYPHGLPPTHGNLLSVGDASAAGPLIGSWSMATVAWLVVAAAIAWACLAIWRTRSAGAFFSSACVVMFAFYLFGPQQDVRYCLPAFVLLLIAVLFDQRYIALFLAANVVVTLNTAIYLLAIPTSSRELQWLSPLYQGLLSTPSMLPFLAHTMLETFAFVLVLWVSGWARVPTRLIASSRARPAGAAPPNAHTSLAPARPQE